MGGDVNDWDRIVVGAGAAGDVLSARLSAAGDARVLLLEAGPDFRTADTPPDFLYRNTHVATPVDRNPDFWWLNLEARHTTAQQPRFYARGRGAGGSTTVNGLIAIRGVPEDFDSWAAAGAEGWSFSDVLPSLCRLEDELDFPDPSYHGRGGPIPIFREPESGWGGMDRALAEAAVKLGYGWAADHNAPGATGASPLAMNIRDGRRVSTNDGYLEPARERPNLTVRGDTLVDRVLFDRDRAVGVVSARAERFELAPGGEVILCCGAVHSPALLMRSGVGPAADLARLGIEVVADLPVGQGFQDHPAVLFQVPVRPEAMAEPHGRHTNLCVRYASGLAEAGPNDMMVLAMNHAASHRHGGFSIWVNRCFSRGRIRLVSRKPEVDPEVDIRLLEDERDRNRLEQALERGRELTESAPLRAIRTGPAVIPMQSRLLEIVSDAKHASGACRLGRPGDAATVVDSDCRVVGVGGLRVADNSIAPEVVRGNTFLTSVMIGEHAFSRTRLAASPAQNRIV